MSEQSCEYESVPNQTCSTIGHFPWELSLCAGATMLLLSLVFPQQSSKSQKCISTSFPAGFLRPFTAFQNRMSLSSDTSCFSLTSNNCLQSCKLECNILLSLWKFCDSFSCLSQQFDLLYACNVLKFIVSIFSPPLQSHFRLPTCPHSPLYPTSSIILFHPTRKTRVHPWDSTS